MRADVNIQLCGLCGIPYAASRLSEAPRRHIQFCPDCNYTSLQNVRELARWILYDERDRAYEIEVPER